jgi:hypothetical protein
VIDPVWNGVGRTLVLRLDDGISLTAAAALAQAIGFSRDGHRISDVDLYDDLAIGFVATADPTRLTQAAPTIALEGVRDAPVFTVDPLNVRVATGGTVVGVSEVSDADGVVDPATWQVTAGSSQLSILGTQASAPTDATDDQPARYRITWALTPSAAETSVSLAFSDDAAAIAVGSQGLSVTQRITLAQVAAGSDPFAFVSNPPYHQRRGVQALVPLALASADGVVPGTDSVDFALTFPESSSATQRAALARIFLPIPSTRQLQVDLSGADAPEPGSTLRCILTANRVVAGAIQIAEQPIVLRVVPALPVTPVGVN